MAGNRATDQDIIFFCENLNHFQAFHFYAITAHTAGHAHTFEHLCRVRRSTHRTRSTLSVVLSMGRFTNTVETVAFYNTLETLSFSSADNINCFTFGEDINSDGITCAFGFSVIAKFQ